MGSNTNLFLTKLLSKFVKRQTKRDDLEILGETNNGTDYLILVVDWAKVDKNSGSYDESYSNFVREKNKKNTGGFFLLGRFDCLTNLTSQAKKILAINLESGFDFKNYDHLDEVEEMISDAIKKSKYPEIKIGFSGDWEKAIIKLTFYNVPQNIYKNWDDLKNYQIELEEIMNNQIALNQYAFSMTMGDKN
jgi:hypothetical protein